METKEKKPTYRYHLTGMVADRRVDMWTTAQHFGHAWVIFKNRVRKQYNLSDAPPNVILKDCTLEGPDPVTGKHRTIPPDYP